MPSKMCILCFLIMVVYIQCQQCQQGYTLKNNHSQECQKCQQNTYKQYYGNDLCTPCVENSRTLKLASTSLSDCHCDHGFESFDVGGGTGESICIPTIGKCAINSFEDPNGNGSCIRCDSIHIGLEGSEQSFYPDRVHERNSSDYCNQCKIGFMKIIRDDGSGFDCVTCNDFSGSVDSPGQRKYGPESAQNTCVSSCWTNSLSGMYFPSNNIEISVCLCFPGHGDLISDNNEDMSCVPCLENMYNDVETNLCKPCMDHSSTNGKTMQSEEGCVCDAGYILSYSVDSRSLFCKLVPILNCLEGFFQTDDHDPIRGSFCKMCHPGSTSPAGSLDHSDCVCVSGYVFNTGARYFDDICRLASSAVCSVGFENVNGVCTSCSSGKYGALLLDIANCLDCQRGTWNTDIGKIGANSCLKCPRGHFSEISGAVSNSVCQKCPSGSHHQTLGASSRHDCLTCACGK